MKKLGSRLWKRKLGVGVLGLQLIASVLLLGVVYKLHMLKDSYAVALGAVMTGLFLIMVVANGVKNKFHYLAMAMSAILVVIFAGGAYYCTAAKNAIVGVTGNNIQVENVAVYVLKENKASTIMDLADSKFAVINGTGGSKTEETVQTINKNVGKTISINDYNDPIEAAKALYKKTVDVIVMDESLEDTIKEHNTYKKFDEETKKIVSYEHKTTLKNENMVSDVTQKPFSVFISGIDTFGDVNKKSRCDVNVIATINPKTKQILLTSTPRDYYVKTTVSGEMKDKLTHAGNFGIKCSVGTLEELYNTKINYYVRVNFSGFKKIIDALGGITVHSDYDFVSAQGPAFVKGDNKMDGKQALAFARERYAVPGGDLQRNRDHQYVVKGVIDKVCSPTILTNFSALMKSVEGNMTTDLKYDDIASFVQMQLDDNAKWNVAMIGVGGIKGYNDYTYSIQHSKKWVMVPSDKMVENATCLINKVLDGEKFTQEQAKAKLDEGVGEIKFR